jgi:SAM-dependent methyltransferase
MTPVDTFDLDIRLVRGRHLPEQDGILRALSDARHAALTAFLDQYRAVREQDGYRATAAAYFRALPATPPDDPQHHVWQVRRRSFERFQRMVAARFGRGNPTVLDLGAGNGWLSHRMACDGCRVVAVDVNDDDRDGLGAGRHYEVPFCRMQADFDDLPFAPRQFDVVVFNGALHYAANVRATLVRVASLVAPGGVIAVIDSPIFDCPAAGRAMRDRARDRFRREYGLSEPIDQGEGYLLFSALVDTARALGRTAHFFESRGDLRWALARVAGRVRHGIRPARFGVWWAV